jgi:hypothetical protein
MKRVVIAAGLLALLAGSALHGVWHLSAMHDKAQVAPEHPVLPSTSAAAPSNITWPPNRSPVDAFNECFRPGPHREPRKERLRRVSDCLHAWHREFPGAPYPRGSTIPLGSQTGGLLDVEIGANL